MKEKHKDGTFHSLYFASAQGAQIGEKMKKRLLATALCATMLFLAVGCGKKDAKQGADAGEKVTILIAAAASMQPSLEELKPMFTEKHPNISIEATYDSSGKLQTQIEEGLEADVFLSAAMKQMNELKDKSMIDADSVKELLENKVVLITPKDGNTTVTGFDTVLNAEKIAIGDPESVPAGQYAKEIFENMGIFADVLAKASLGTNVTEVLNWVAEGSADAGVVYATDAATTDKVTVIGEAPEGTLAKPVIYPIGIVSGSQKKDAAKTYVEFLQSAEAKAILEKYGFEVK